MSTTTTLTAITLVTAPGCHFCEDAQEVLGRLAADRPDVGIDRVEATSTAGRVLLAAHRPALFPLVLVDGAFFSAGRLPRRKLEVLLARRGVPTAVSRG